MRLPELCYRFLYPKDTSGPTFELDPMQLDTAAAAASQTITFTGPAKDRVFVLTNVQMDLTPGATQSAIRALLSGITPGGLAFNIVQESFLVDADERRQLNWQGEVMIGGSGVENTILTAIGQFSAGVASNALGVAVFGYVIPRGNIAPF